MHKDSIFFTKKLIAANSWAISGAANDLMYLIVGKSRAMLVDTGMGIGNLAEFIRELTVLPLIVVNTHGHPDHAGGNSQFEEVWIHPQDTAIMQEMCSDEYRLADIKAFMGANSPEVLRFENHLIRHKPFLFRSLFAGQIIDLGDSGFEVIEIPGHTPGSIALLNSKAQILVTGDSIVQTPVWLYLKHSLPLTVYKKALENILNRINDYYTLLPGHLPSPLKITQLEDLIACSIEILKNPGKGQLTKTFAGQGLLWKHGSGTIIYDPQNIF